MSEANLLILFLILFLSCWFLVIERTQLLAKTNKLRQAPTNQNSLNETRATLVQFSSIESRSRSLVGESGPLLLLSVKVDCWPQINGGGSSQPMLMAATSASSLLLLLHVLGIRSSRAAAAVHTLSCRSDWAEFTAAELEAICSSLRWVSFSFWIRWWSVWLIRDSCDSYKQDKLNSNTYIIGQSISRSKQSKEKQINVVSYVMKVDLKYFLLILWTLLMPVLIICNCNVR